MKILIGKYPKGDGEQKVSIRIDPHDTYSMDCTLALIIVPMLKQLKKTMHGYPSEMLPEMPDGYWDEPKDGPIHKRVKANEKAAIKRWNGILDKMIWSFTQVNKDWERKFWSGRHDIKWEKQESGGRLIVYGPKHTAKYDREGAAAYGARIQEGIDLFAKYYFNLWD